MTRIVLIRHGESNVTASRRAQQGKADGRKAPAHQRRARRPKH